MQNKFNEHNKLDFNIMGKKEYSKPVMSLEVFKPQEYVAMCEYYLDGIDPINNTSITSSTKFWYDDGQDGIINGTDYDHHHVSQTDGAGWGYKDEVVKAWWAVDNNVGNDIYAHPEKFADYQSDGKAGYVDAVYDPTDKHYHAGTIRMKKNHS